MHLRSKNHHPKNFLKVFFSILLTFLILGFLISFSEKSKSFINKKNFILRKDKILETENKNLINIQIADEDKEREKGLGKIKDLKIYVLDKKQNTFETEAMFFVFENLGIYNFWMKDTLMDLDILWLDENLKIVHLEKKVSRFSYNYTNPNLSQIFKNDENSLAKYVLEIKSGFSEKLNLKVGDKFIYKYF